MRRGLLVTALTAAACLAQSGARGFVNYRPFSGSILTGALREKVVPATPPAKTPPCLRVSPRERVVIREDVDPKMIVRVPAKSVDPKMVVNPAPVCPDK